jgi:hypothetical protein
LLASYLIDERFAGSRKQVKARQAKKPAMNREKVLNHLVRVQLS